MQADAKAPPSRNDVQNEELIVPAWGSLLSASKPQLTQDGTLHQEYRALSRLWRALITRRPDLSQAGTMIRSACATSRLGRVWRVREAISGDPGATSRLWRKSGAQDPGFGEEVRRIKPPTCENAGGLPCPAGRISPKAGSCADAGRFRRPKGRNSPKPGRCAEDPAQRPCFGEPPRPRAHIPPKPGRRARSYNATSRLWRAAAARYASLSQAGTMFGQTLRISPT